MEKLSCVSIELLGRTISPLSFNKKGLEMTPKCYLPVDFSLALYCCWKDLINNFFTQFFIPWTYHGLPYHEYGRIFMRISNLIKGLLPDELIVFQDMLCFLLHFVSPLMISLELYFTDKIQKFQHTQSN